MTVYYDPDSPDEARLYQGASKGGLTLLFSGGGVCIAVGIGIMLVLRRYAASLRRGESR